ncbi:NEAT domain-containing protein [Secundilactobacillus muriivasis]
MKRKMIKGWLGGVLAVVLAIITMSSASLVKADTLSDGDYTVPVRIWKDGTNQQTPSAAQGFMSETATITVKNGQYQGTLNILPDGRQALTSMTFPSGPAHIDATTGDVTFTLNSAEPLVSVTCAMFGGAITAPADLTFDWADATRIGDQSGNNSATEVDNSSSSSQVSSSSLNSSSSSSSSSSSNSSSNSSSSSSSSASTSSTSSSVPSSSSNSSSQISNQTWAYTVLSADQKTVSMANQYYTHVAEVTPVDGHYQVTMTVTYAKDAGLQKDGFKPLTVAGNKVSDVTYSESGKNYVVQFKFNVDQLDQLAKPLKGTIHVAVSLVNIDADFDVYYQFSQASGTDNAGQSSASNTSTTDGPTTGESSQTSDTDVTELTSDVDGDTNEGSDGSATVQKAVTKRDQSQPTSKQSTKENLPQTSEQRQVVLTIVGLVSCVGLIGFVIYRRRVAK